jgi:hypothetical protein
MIGARYPVAGIRIVRKQRKRLSDIPTAYPRESRQAGRDWRRAAEALGIIRSRWRDFVQHLTCRVALLGVLQNDAAPMIIDKAPFFDLLQRSKAAEASIVVV